MRRIRERSPVNLIGPVIALTAGSILLVTALLGFSVASLDRDAQASAQQMARSIMLGQIDTLRFLASDYSGWDEAIENTAGVLDPQWVDDNLGPHLHNSQGVWGAWVVDPADRLRIGHIGKDRITEPPPLAGDPATLELIRRTRAAAEQAGYPAGATFPMAGFVPGPDGVPMIVVASAMVPWQPRFETPRGWVLVIALAIDEPYLAEIAASYPLSDLRASAALSPLPEEGAGGAVALEGVGGRTVAWLTFQPDRPGERLFLRLLPLIGAIFVMILVVGGWTLRRAMVTHRLQRTLIERLAEERDAAARADRAKSEFLAQMSHELRTPLNAVIGLAEMMRMGIGGTLSPKHADYVASSEEAGRHLLSLIDDILDVARIETGRETLAEADVTVDELFRSVSTLIAPRCRMKRIMLVIETAPEIDALHVDPRKTKQMLLNLLSNAVKFSPAGTAVTLAARRSAAGEVVLEVADRGPGIEPEELARLGRPFTRGRHAVVEGQEGAGLGLAITRSFMELHGGRLELRSAPGRGTTAALIFPPERVSAGRRPESARGG